MLFLVAGGLVGFLGLWEFYQRPENQQQHANGQFVHVLNDTPEGDRYDVYAIRRDSGVSLLERRGLSESFTFRIQNKCSDLFIGISEAGQNPGERALQWDRAHDGSQDWLIETSGNEGIFHIRNANSGLYLGVREASEQNGMDIIQWNQADDGSQDWRIIANPEDEGYVAIVNAHNSKYWAIFEASRARGENLIQWDASGNNDQLWKLVNQEGPIIGSAIPEREPPLL